MVDAKVIQEEIDRLKKEELRLIQQSIIDDMESIIGNFDMDGEFNETKFTNLTNKIKSYFNPAND